MKKYLFVFTHFVAALGLTSCSSDDDNEELAGIWSVIGYGSDEQFVNIDEDLLNSMKCRISIHDNGRFAYHIRNTFYGNYRYSSKSGAFAMSDMEATMIYVMNKDLNHLEDLVHKYNRARVSGDLLKLYYSDTEYVLFKRGGVGIADFD